MLLGKKKMPRVNTNGLKFILMFTIVLACPQCKGRYNRRVLSQVLDGNPGGVEDDNCEGYALSCFHQNVVQEINAENDKDSQSSSSIR